MAAGYQSRYNYQLNMKLTLNKSSVIGVDGESNGGGAKAYLEMAAYGG